MSSPSIPENLATIQAKIETACKNSHRSPQDVHLIAVSKFQPITALESALKAGQCLFGENYLQEAQEKFLTLSPKYPNFKGHFIGALQSKKAKAACEIADAIHTLDRESLCQALQKAADKTGRLPHLFIQINIGKEAHKSGVPLDKADFFIEKAQSLFGEKIKGLMCIPPQSQPALPYFQKLSTLAKKHGLKELSMGMSSDFEAAIAAGATYLRVGTALFGKRPSSKNHV